MLRRLLLDGLKTGVALAATTTAAIMFFSKREKGSHWAGVNAIAHVANGGGRTSRTFSPSQTPIGLAVHSASMIAWGLVYRAALSLVNARGVVPASIATLAIGFVDYELLPRRFSPGFERIVGPLGVGATFAALGATLALSDTFTSARSLPAGGDDDPESWFV
jgi:hypothetical protein